MRVMDGGQREGDDRGLAVLLSPNYGLIVIECDHVAQLMGSECKDNCT
jgi:hypothetical protein